MTNTYGSTYALKTVVTVAGMMYQKREKLLKRKKKTKNKKQTTHNFQIHRTIPPSTDCHVCIVRVRGCIGKIVQNSG